MIANLGRADRLIRALIGLILIMAPLGNIPPIWDSGLAAYVSMGVGVVLIATAFIRFCPLYRVVGISTCKT
ncbi:DUF2892 domain-containing protein [uncultured Tateyamaria sp.]|uniref:YgaP family membrane protein n=1 Tax=uncultured Tateyamaria sp. TaxID=455651 RepID=UPI002619D3A0|nr:DUF2892 domain-containing protein [uncultured Tateyamaria sp.]